MSDSKTRIRIALLDDHPIVRYGITVRLSEETDFTVVGSYNNGSSMINGLRDDPAEVLLVDYTLGSTDLEGISLIRGLVTKFPESNVLVFSSLYYPVIIALVLRAGCRGFVGKCQDVEQIVRAIRTVASGAVHVDAEMSCRLADLSVTVGMESTLYNLDSDETILMSAKLSIKEREVVRCCLHGMTISDIANKCNRSLKTISTQKIAAFRKLGVRSDNELFKIRYIVGSV